MKIRKGCLVSLMVGIFLGCLTFSTVHAQDMSIWVGKWFKLTVKYSGYSTNDSGIISSNKETNVNYLKIWNVNEANKVVNFYSYNESDQWRGESVDFRYTGGNSLDFLCYYFECEWEDLHYCFGFTGRIQGKMKGGILTSATIKSLGGFEWSAPRGAAGVTVTGSLIPESKLPPDIPK
jgi:hypothetical protein